MRGNNTPLGREEEKGGMEEGEGREGRGGGVGRRGAGRIGEG